MLQHLTAPASRRGAASIRLASSRSSALRFCATRAVTATCGASSFSTNGGVAPFSIMSERFASSYSRQKRGKQDEPKEQLNISRIAVIGGGNMAEAIITGVLSEELIPREKIVVSDPNPDIRKKYQSKDIVTSDRNVTAVKDADVIVMAVKPQVLKEVMESFHGSMKSDALVISVVAGATIDGMQAILGTESRIIRTMPNTPAMIGEGMTVWSQSSEVTEEQHALTKSILGAFGIEVFVDDESSLDMATALSGSGPAYFFLVAEAMIDTGVHMGFSRAVATKLVQQTMLGSALYMQASDVHPVVLRNNITSPGGTTAAALYRAEKNGFRAVIADSIWAAYERCVELGSPTPVQRKRPRS
uniref:Pyrroline-5-carboxylate reductase n=1 Tax=Globisporangium ultimum (strain ATCC 200006 / CBS 805.95 / DAOM BR144) TaxID=431595 RepID=K3WDN1_GLOUD